MVRSYPNASPLLWLLLLAGLLASGCTKDETKVRVLPPPGTKTDAGVAEDVAVVPDLPATPDPGPIAEDVAALPDGAHEDAGPPADVSALDGCKPIKPLVVTPDTPESNGATWTFTCTTCPGGPPAVGAGGLYRYYETTLNQPDLELYRETLQFDGAAFQNAIQGFDQDDKYKQLQATGYVVCPHPSELTPMANAESFNAVLVYESASPTGAFGVDPGDVDLARIVALPLGPAGEAIRIDLNLEWALSGDVQLSATYCRVGAIFGGTECKNPFLP